MLQNEWHCVRHGQGENNLKPALTSPEEGYIIGLTELGKQQAAHFALQDSGWDVIVSSPYLRAQQTADIFAHVAGVEVQTELDFRELNFGDLIGHSKEEYRHAEATQNYEIPYPGGESLQQVAERAWAAIEKWDKQFEGQRILLVAHALVFRGLGCKLTGELTSLNPENGHPFALDGFEYPLETNPVT